MHVSRRGSSIGYLKTNALDLRTDAVGLAGECSISINTRLRTLIQLAGEPSGGTQGRRGWDDETCVVLTYHHAFEDVCKARSKKIGQLGIAKYPQVQSISKRREQDDRQ
jgi:hypothetical protein